MSDQTKLMAEQIASDQARIGELEGMLADAKGAAALNLAQLKQWRARAEKAEARLDAEAEREFGLMSDWGRV